VNRRALEDRSAALVAGVCRPFPRGVSIGVGGSLGSLLGDLDGRHVAVALDNLRHAFPNWDDARLFRTARGVYRHFGKVLLDILWMQNRSQGSILSLVEVRGAEHVHAAMGLGRGAVLATCHMGNWELHGVAHGWIFGPIGVVARPLDNPALDARLCAVRTQGGNSVFYKNKALAQTLRFLREGRAVAILVDQNVQEKDGIYVDFFDRKAATTTVAAALAVKTGCAILPCYTRLSEQGRYQLHYEAALDWKPTGDRAGDIAHLTQMLTSRIEAWVRETPEQWLWIHRRWKTRPAENLPLPIGATRGSPA
jgi:KDO2-lipid IV(A) lauroyltransferase